MSDAAKRPWPTANPTNFSKLVIKKNLLSQDKARVIHMDVKGENNGESYKILGVHSPFVMRHLEKTFNVDFGLNPDPADEKEPVPEPRASSSNKRERPADRLAEQPNPSVLSDVARKRPRQE